MPNRSIERWRCEKPKTIGETIAVRIAECARDDVARAVLRILVRPRTKPLQSQEIWKHCLRVRKRLRMRTRKPTAVWISNRRRAECELLKSQREITLWCRGIGVRWNWRRQNRRRGVVGRTMGAVERVRHPHRRIGRRRWQPLFVRNFEPPPFRWIGKEFTRALARCNIDERELGEIGDIAHQSPTIVRCRNPREMRPVRKDRNRRKGRIRMRIRVSRGRVRRRAVVNQPNRFRASKPTTVAETRIPKRISFDVANIAHW